jgi:putative ABC transport system substrate-binding protein
MTENSPFYRVFFAELRRLGLIEGDNLVVERYSSSGLKEPFAELADKVVHQKPDLIFAVTSRFVRALKLATPTIPIVGVMGEPVAWGLVESLGRPGGNVTGVVVDAGNEILGKQLELLEELLPRPSSVGFLVSRGVWESSAGLVAQEAAQRMGVSLFGAILESFDEAEYRRVFATMKLRGVAGVLIATQSENLTNRKLIVDLARESQLPTLHPWREHVDLGGLISYGPSRAEYMRHAAGQIDQILKGAKPADLPVIQSTKFELVINLETAKALGIAIPPSLLARADDVIE